MTQKISDYNMCTFNGGNTTTKFDSRYGDYEFTSNDRELFGNETFSLKIEDITHYGVYTYTLTV